jgi:hypothetical protein
MTELLQALILEDVEPDITLDELLLDMLTAADIIECCKSLVVYEESSGLVRFAHFTVHQYITEHASDRLPPATHLAKSCLTCLAIPAFDACSHLPLPYKPFVKFRFYSYAYSHWAQHTVGEAESLPGIQRVFLMLYHEPHTLLHVTAILGFSNLCEHYLKGDLNDMYLPL